MFLFYVVWNTDCSMDSVTCSYLCFMVIDGTFYMAIIYIMALYFALRLSTFGSYCPNSPPCFGTPQALFHKTLISIAWTADVQKAKSSCMLVGITCSLDIGCIWLTAGVSHIMKRFA